MTFWPPDPGWCQADGDFPAEATTVAGLVNPFQERKYSNNEQRPAPGTLPVDLSSRQFSLYALSTEPVSIPAGNLSPESNHLAWSQSSCGGQSQSSHTMFSPTDHVERPQSQSHMTQIPGSAISDDAANPMAYYSYQPMVTSRLEPRKPVESSERPSDANLRSPVASSYNDEDGEASQEPDRRPVKDTDQIKSSRGSKRWKAAHRAVERRYRSNLNLKIVRLARCIPAIHDQAVATEEIEESVDRRNFPKTKLQKGHILSEAVEYIQLLERHVSKLESEKGQLDSRVQALHMVMQGNPKGPAQTCPDGQQSDMPRQLMEYQECSDNGRIMAVHHRTMDEARLKEESMSQAPAQFPPLRSRCRVESWKPRPPAGQALTG